MRIQHAAAIAPYTGALDNADSPDRKDAVCVSLMHEWRNEPQSIDLDIELLDDPRAVKCRPREKHETNNDRNTHNGRKTYVTEVKY